MGGRRSVEALRKDETVVVEEEEEEDESSEDEEEGGDAPAEEVEDTLLGRTKSIIAKTAERTTDLIDKTQEQLDRLDERTEALVTAAAKTLKKTSSDVKDWIVGPPRSEPMRSPRRSRTTILLFGMLFEPRRRRPSTLLWMTTRAWRNNDSSTSTHLYYRPPE